MKKNKASFIRASGKQWYYDRFQKLYRNLDNFSDEVTEEDLRLMVLQESTSRLENSINRLCSVVSDEPEDESPFTSTEMFHPYVINRALENMNDDTNRIEDEKDGLSDLEKITDEHVEHDTEQEKSDAFKVDSYEKTEDEQKFENESLGYENEDESYEENEAQSPDQEQFESEEYDEEILEMQIEDSENYLDSEYDYENGSGYDYDFSDDSDVSDYMEGDFDDDVSDY
jgi:hypothetical protein